MTYSKEEVITTSSGMYNMYKKTPGSKENRRG